MSTSTVMLPTVFENEYGSEDPDQQLWIEQYYNSSHESDDEFCSEFNFSGIGYNAFRLSDNGESYSYGQETIDEQSELVISSQDNRETSSRTTILNGGQPDERVYSVPEFNKILVQIMNSIFSDIFADQYKVSKGGNCNDRRELAKCPYQIELSRPRTHKRFVFVVELEEGNTNEQSIMVERKYNALQTILYHKLSDNAAFEAYLYHARNLQNVQLKEASPNEKLALFINVYNMMIIHMTYLQGPPRNVWDRRKLMNCTYYQIEDHKYAPHSILDGILRSNRKGLEMLWKPFGKKDARLSLILPHCEPLVHFALNNCTRSTHSMKAYTCENVRKELRETASDALESESNVRLDVNRRILYFSKLFQWYAVDFGYTTDKVIEWILWVMEGSKSEKKKNLEILYHSGHYEVDYLPYDWSFNGKMRE